jgi:hypothetical protein
MKLEALCSSWSLQCEESRAFGTELTQGIQVNALLLLKRSSRMDHQPESLPDRNSIQHARGGKAVHFLLEGGQSYFSQ